MLLQQNAWDFKILNKLGISKTMLYGVMSAVGLWGLNMCAQCVISFCIQKTINGMWEMAKQQNKIQDQMMEVTTKVNENSCVLAANVESLRQGVVAVNERVNAGRN